MASGVRITNWRGPAIVKMCVERSRPILEAKAGAVTTHLQSNIEEPYPPASSPGEPPHKRTGDLRASWNVEFAAPGKVQITSDSPYASYLEFGTRKMAARPFIRRSLLEKRGLFSRVEVV